MRAASGLPLGALAEVEQGREVGLGAHKDMAAAAAVTAVGAAFGNEFLPAKGRGSGSTGSRLHMKDRAVYEHCITSFCLSHQPRSPRPSMRDPAPDPAPRLPVQIG